MVERRKDSRGRVLKENESERANHTYQYRWRDKTGKRHYIYAKTLEELREKEIDIQKNRSNGIRIEDKNVTVNDIFNLWVELKKGIKNNTFQNYIYMYVHFVQPDFGKIRLIHLKRSDVRRFYNILADQRNIKITSIESIHTVLYQVLELAVEDNYLSTNPADNALKELKRTHNFENEKRKALTVKEQEVFIKFLNESLLCKRWKPIFTVMINTGLRVGELTGLRWNDIDFEKNTIEINHTLVYYKHNDGCYYSINTPKTKSGYRTIPMLDSVRNALLEEREYQLNSGVPQDITIDGYTNFIFINRYGNVQNQSMLNKALRYIIRECNQEIIDKYGYKEDIVFLPRFTCHNLRHTFATRLCECGTNIKVIQEVLGHRDIKTTMNIYTDATQELKNSEFIRFNDYLKAQNSIYTSFTPEIHPKSK